jgi:hypothetical protein
MLSSESRQKASPARLLEMLSDRFGAFEAIAYSSIKLARGAGGGPGDGRTRGGGDSGVRGRPAIRV